jgi:hypothetical protein
MKINEPLKKLNKIYESNLKKQMIINQSKKIQKLLLSTVIGINALVFSNCKKDTLLAPDAQNTSLHASANTMLVLTSSTPTYNIENSLPSGYVKDGSRDYTTYIQKAILNNSHITFPAFPILINDTGLLIPSNRTLTFSEGSELRMKPSSKTGYKMLELRGVTNVTLINPVLKGDRRNHIGTSGEWGNGISINGGSNITVLSPKATEFWGDGIYIGVEQGVIPRNITIKDAFVKQNRRNGITVTAVDGLLLESPYAGFTDGTLPMAGIAFEPNTNKEEIKNVIINNPKTESNLGAGIFFSLGNLMGAGQKIVSVVVNNHTDVKSTIGVRAGSRVSDGTSTIQGDLIFKNPNWSQNPSKAIKTLLYTDKDVHIIISDPIVRDISNRQLSKSETFSYLNHKLQINPSAYREVTFSANWPLINTGTPTTPTTPIGALIAAVHAGGAAVTASNGITYQADKSFSGGSVYKNLNEILNTTDDALFQSERNGNFSYNIPVSSGTYEITFRFAEIYFSASGQRQFDILTEGNRIVSGLDLFQAAGKNSPLDIVKEVVVTDGTLNMQFVSSINKAKISAFHITKKL